MASSCSCLCAIGVGWQESLPLATASFRAPTTRGESLEGFWKPALAKTHAIMAKAFENVVLHRVEGRDLAAGEAEQSVVPEFRPRQQQDMLVALPVLH
jgi:hypothetical protein